GARRSVPRGRGRGLCRAGAARLAAGGQDHRVHRRARLDEPLGSQGAGRGARRQRRQFGIGQDRLRRRRRRCRLEGGARRGARHRHARRSGLARTGRGRRRGGIAGVPTDALYYELPEARALRPERTALPAEDRIEPSLAAAPYFVEFEEPERLDPERLGLIPDEPPPTPQAMRLRAPLGSLAAHLATLVVILTATAVPPELPRPIPISLVFEAPPPPAPPRPEAAAPKPGRLASEDVGDPSAPPKQPGDDAAQPVAEQSAPSPKPAPPQQVAAISLPKPPAAPHPAAAPHDGGRRARVPGPAATRDEYLAYL